MICGPVLYPGRAPDWDRLQPGRRRAGPRIGRADTAQFAGPAASVLSDEPNGLRKEEKRGCIPMEMDTTDLIARARAGDHNAFRDLVQGHSHELQVHCYRILGSLQDAEDALQETLVSAWRNLGEFGQRSSLRTWLYQIATNRCLSMLRADSRRPRIAPRCPRPPCPNPPAPATPRPGWNPTPTSCSTTSSTSAPDPRPATRPPRPSPWPSSPPCNCCPHANAPRSSSATSWATTPPKSPRCSAPPRSRKQRPQTRPRHRRQPPR